MTGRRLRPLLVLAGVVLAGLTLLAWTQPWHDLVVDSPQGGTVTVTSDGDVAGGALAALALASLALCAALTIAGVVFRLVLGVLQVALGACVVVAAALALADPVGVSASVVTTATGVDGTDSLAALVEEVSTTPWPFVGLVAGALTALHGVAVVATARRWPATGRRYQAVRTVPADAAPDAAATWDVLSAGDDPTTLDDERPRDGRPGPDR